MVSMPNVALVLLNYRPSVFILPFLLLIFYFALQDSTNWKLIPVVWLSIFIITISHTGTFMFLISASLGFFLLYSFIWGKFSRNMYITIISTFLIYLVTLNWFPEILNQYAVKSTLFLSPGNFLANRFNFVLVKDFASIFYKNFFVGQQLVYVILLAAALYGIAQVLICNSPLSHGQSGSKKYFSCICFANPEYIAFCCSKPDMAGPVACSPVCRRIFPY